MNKIIRVFLFSGLLLIGAAAMTVAHADTASSSVADLSVVKTVSNPHPQEGDAVTYTVRISNLGPDVATSVVATDMVPTGLTVTSATSSMGTYDAATGVWTIGDMTATSTPFVPGSGPATASMATLVVNATVNTGTANTTIVNTAAVGSDSASASITVAPNLSCGSVSRTTVVSDATNITETGAPAVPVETPYHPNWTASIPGATWIWNAATIDNPFITEGHTFTKTFSVSGTPISAILTIAGDNEYLVAVNGKQVAVSTGAWNFQLQDQQQFDIASALQNGTNTMSITDTNLAQPGCGLAPPLCNPAGLLYRLDIDSNACTVNVPQVADIAVAKTVDNATPHQGDIVNYTVTVSDLGPASSTGVVASDTLPSGLTFLSATTSEGSYASSTGIWTIGSLSASSTATLHIAAQVNASSGTVIVNTAAAKESASSTDPNLGNNVASVPMKVQAQPVGPGSISICKAIINASGTVMDGAAFPGNIFMIPGVDSSPSSTTPVVGVLPTSTFATPLVSNTALFNSPTSNAQCITYNDLPLGLYRYGRESIVNSSSQWAVPLYNDQETVAASTTSDLFPYTGQYPSSTGLRNDNSDGYITLVSSRPVRQLVVLNQYLGTSATTTPTSTIADVSITKTVDNASPAVGDTINYTLTASALGPATSTGVVATDTLPSGLTFVNATASVGTYASSTGTWTIGDLASGSTATLDIAAQVNAGDAGQTITNTAIIGESASSTDNNPSNNSSSVPITVQGGGGGVMSDGSITVCKAIIDASGTVVDGSALPGNIFTIPGVSVIPTSTAAAAGVLPASTFTTPLTLNAALFGSSTNNAQCVTYSNLPIGHYYYGQESIVSSSSQWAAPEYNDQEFNIASTTSDFFPYSGQLFDNDPSNDGARNITADGDILLTSTRTNRQLVILNQILGAATTTPPADADIAITKTVDNANPVVGATVNYTITVTALGPATSSIVAAQDILPGGLSLVSASTSVGTYDMSTGNWTIGLLGPNETATLLIAASVANNEAGQTITNTATVSELSSLVDPDLANNSSSVSINVQPAACTSNCGTGGGGTTGGGGGGISTAEIAITKTVDNANPNPGDTINYTVTVQGLGPAASLGVVATDTLPAGVTFVSATPSVGTYATSTGTWTLGNVAAGAKPTLVITAIVNSSDPIGETITNTAIVGESTSVNDPLSGNNSSSATITVGGSNGGGGGGGGTSGGGGNGGTSGGGGNGGGSNGGGQVLGASASCGIYLDQYIHPVRKYLNDPTEVDKLQTFLNMNLGTTLPITGYYGNETIAAVDQFQVKYHIEVLQPWLNYGLPTEYTPTDYVYKTTQRWINLIMCSSLNLPIPQLP